MRRIDNDEDELKEQIKSYLKMQQEEEEEILSTDAHWLLIYASDETIKEVLWCVDNWMIGLIKERIRITMEVIGYRICDIQYQETNFFSRMQEKRKWRHLYRICRRCQIKNLLYCIIYFLLKGEKP